MRRAVMPPTFVAFSILFVVSTLVALSGGLARAAAPPAGRSALEVDLRGETTAPLLSSTDRGFPRDEAWSGFLSRNPGWEARWDTGRDAPVRLDGAPVAVPGFSMVEPDNAEAAARAFLRAECSAWIPEADLVLERIAADRTGFWVSFEQTRDGLSVWDSRVSVRIGRTGRVSTVINHSRRDLTLTGSARVAQAVALEQARTGLPGTPEPAAEMRTVCLPIAKGGKTEARLVFVYEFTTADPPGHWFSFVDAQGGGLLWRVNRVAYAHVGGTVTGMIEPLKADGDFQQLPLSSVNARLEVAGDLEGTFTTDAAGSYSFTTAATTGRVVKVPLEGPYGKINDVGDGNFTPEMTAPVPDGEEATVDFTFVDANADPAARDVFYHAMLAHDRIKTIDPGFTALDYQMPLNVDMNSGTCNAFWNGWSLNFYAEGGGCVNFGRIGDVVYHEYAHGISTRVYDPDWPADFLGEAFSDYFASSITGQSCLGPDYGHGPCIRDLSEDKIYPQDWSTEPHTGGLILGTALWDMKELLGRDHSDSLWYFALQGRAETFDDYFLEILRADDSDDDIYNGTPNLNAIAGVFKAHGIGDYSIHVIHDPEPDTENTDKEFPLTATFRSIYALDPATVQLHYLISPARGGVAVDTTMTPTGASREYRITLPAQPAGTTVSYWFTASDTEGGTVTEPAGGAADPYVFRIGTDTTPPWIAYEVIEPQPADMPVWRIFARAGDNLDLPLDAVSFVWKRNLGGAVTVPMTSLGGDRYLAEIDATGFAAGDLLEYRVEAEDGAAVPNHTAVPEAGFNSFHLVQGWLKDFEANSGGLTGNTGNQAWEWGTPDPDMGVWSGTKAWATNLYGAYQNESRYFLDLPPFDLSAVTAAGLTFRHHYMTEAGWDGCWVEVSTDAGQNWSVLRPDGDYPVAHLDVSGGPAWSGASEWQEARFDLFPYLGQADCRVRLVLGTDQAVVDRGWIVDDIAFVQRQIPGRPLSITATQGEHGKVTLDWLPPAGLSNESSTPVRGYNLWRSTEPEGAAFMINPELLTSRHYVDTAVVNGTRYWYFATAVYENEESGPSDTAEGWPYEPHLMLPSAEVAAEVDSGSVTPATLAVQNSGTGLLELNLYPAEDGKTIDDVRLLVNSAVAGKAPLAPVVPVKDKDGAMTARVRPELNAEAGPKAVPPGEDTWVTLAGDPDEGSDPDFSLIELAQDATMVKFRITSHRPWGDPRTDFTFRIGIELDNNVQTGGSPGGFEVLILGGKRSVENFGGRLGVLVYTDASGMTVGVTDLPLIELAAGDSVAVIGVTKESLGWPEHFVVQFMVKSADWSTYLDAVPDFVSIPWMALAQRHAVVGTDAPADLGFTLGHPALEIGDYAAQVFVTSNDSLNPVAPVPVRLSVLRQNTPVFLSAFTAEPAGEGVTLAWSVNASAGQARTLVYRTEISPVPGEEELLTVEPILSPVDGEARYLDRTATPGSEYEYRLEVLNRDGTRETAGTLRVTVIGTALPATVMLGRPSPNPTAAGMSVRFGLPRAANVLLDVVGADGRKVRTLLDRDPESAGWHTVTWDGTNDAGREASSGSYFLRLRANGRECSQKLVVLRSR